MNDILLSVIIIIIIVLVVYLFITFILDILYKRFLSQRKKIFNNLLSPKLEKGLIKDKEDIQIIYNTLLNKSNYIFRYTIPLISLIEEFLAETNNIDLNNYTILKEILKKENNIFPFEGVPAEEKVILSTISESLKDKGLFPLVDSLAELGPIMSARYNNFNKTAKQTKWSLIFGILGVIVGVLSIIYSAFF